MANEEHLKTIKQGVVAWDAWRTESPLERPSLANAELEDKNFSGIDFSRADLTRASLARADLSEANLTFANLVGTDLSGADLYRADLSWADLSWANLEGADLTGADLFKADLSRANLKRTACESVILGHTVLADVDLTSLVDSDINHLRTSTIDHRSIARSLQCQNLLPFLLTASEMPHLIATSIIDAARALDPNGLFNLMHSTFISYGGPDETFAQKLQQALYENGVRTFLFTSDAAPGQPISDVMLNQVRGMDRIIVICSEWSLDRPGVMTEMAHALRREAQEGGPSLLIPIALDDYVYTGWNPKNPDLKDTILDRVIADFRGAKTDQRKFNEGLARLLEALRIRS